MSNIYSFNELNIEKTFGDAIEINEIRYKLIKVIELKDVEICENILQKKGITDYYFIKTDTKNIGIFVSYFQFNNVFSFLEDERVPNTKMKLSEFIKKYENYSFGYVNNVEDMKSTTVSSVRKSNVVLQNFEDISKSKAISNVLKKWFFIILWINIGSLLATLLKAGNIIPKFQILMNVLFVPIILLLALIEILDADKRKFKIENFEDKIMINGKKIILHQDINKVYIDNYIYGWSGNEKPKNTHLKLGFGLDYGRYETRRILNIEYNSGHGIKKKKFQLKYVNEVKLEEFLDLFR